MEENKNITVENLRRLEKELESLKTEPYQKNSLKLIVSKCSGITNFFAELELAKEVLDLTEEEVNSIIKDTFGKITTEEDQLNELKRILEEIRRGIKITDLENKINFIKSKLDPEQLYNFVFISPEL